MILQWKWMRNDFYNKNVLDSDFIIKCINNDFIMKMH